MGAKRDLALGHIGAFLCIAPVRTALRDLVEDEDIGV
jgi:hypothetical protein